MAEYSLAFIVFIVIVALAFDFMNGFHDAANSIATIVSTRVLRPQTAVAWAAFFNVAAYFVFEVKVATTIGKGVVDASTIDPNVVLAALSGALLWNIITWWFGIPSSSSHALVGGLVGAGVAKSGVAALQAPGLIKIAVSIVASPLIGFLLAFAFMTIVANVFFRTPGRKVDKWARRFQFVSASLFSLGHGGNDAQKTAGIITVLLFSTGHLTGDFHVPTWVVLACYATIGLGTLFGGWRIVETMGMRITKLKPIGGSCAETAGAITLFAASGLGIPVSTTHTITGSIFGVGSTINASAVRWGVAERIVVAWILTIPATAFCAAVVWAVVSAFA